MKNKNKSFLLIAIVLSVGLYFGDQVLLQPRKIASVSGPVTTTTGAKEYFDLTEIPDAEFPTAYKTALINGLVVEKTDTTMGVAWGQFMLKNESGGKVYACDKFPFIEVVLKAEGVAHSGELPSLTVRGPCLTSDDGKKIMALPLPLEKLMAPQKDEVAEMKIPLGTRGDGFTVTPKHLVGPVPRYWNVTNLKLYNEKESLSVDGYEMISLLDQALTLDFAAAE